MGNRIFQMSQKELDRLKIIERLKNKQINQIEAASQLGLSARQVRRLQHAYKQEGTAGLISKLRGKASNNRLSPVCLAEVVRLIKNRYSDFGPTLAHEKLTEKHGLKLSLESVRGLMIAEGFWEKRRRKTLKVYQRRERRSSMGELIQVDGSHHDWFEGRSRKCCLLVFVDDATSRLMHLHFAEEEDTDSYFAAMKVYLLKHGRPLCLYSDKHSVFRITARECDGGSGETQFGRAMRELGIELICANSPQAKGRVEKANGTLQDRLVKEMRLQGISDIRSANKFLPEFIEGYNKRFAVEPVSLINAHQKELPSKAVLDLILAHQYERIISKNLEISYGNVIHQIQKTTRSYNMKGSRVTVVDQLGKVKLLYKDELLKYKTINKRNQPVKVINNKQLPKSILSASKETHPWMRYALNKIKTKPAEPR